MMRHKALKLICFALLPLAAPAMAADEMPTIDGTRLEVQARGVVRVVPDLLLLRASVVTQAPDAVTAMRENAARMARAQAVLRQAGIKDQEMRTEAVLLTPQYRYTPDAAPRVSGYQATNSLSIRLRDVTRAGSLVDTLVGQGINQIEGPTFLIEDRTGAEDRARVRALQSVQARAQLYARSAGMTVHRILSLSEGAEGAPPMAYLTARSAASDARQAPTEMMAGEQEVSVTINAVFELRPAH